MRPRAPGSSASAGSRTSSRVMSHWIDARIDSFGSIGVAVKPSVAVGTTKPRMPSSVCAQMIATSAIEASPIQRLAPVSTQPASVRRGRPWWPCSPGRCRRSARSARSSRSARRRAIPGSHRCFCSSEPNLCDGAHRQRALHGDEGADAGVAGLQLHRRQAVLDGASGRRSRSPSGACRAGRARPSPGPARAGRCAVAYQPAMFGRIRSSTKARTRSRRASSSAREQAVEVEVVVGEVEVLLRRPRTGRRCLCRPS